MPRVRVADLTPLKFAERAEGRLNWLVLIVPCRRVNVGMAAGIPTFTASNDKDKPSRPRHCEQIRSLTWYFCAFKLLSNANIKLHCQEIS